jgi:hypothetical protein
MMENNDELSRDLFLNEQDICKLVGKLAKKTYNITWEWCLDNVNVGCW